MPPPMPYSKPDNPPTYKASTRSSRLESNSSGPSSSILTRTKEKLETHPSLKGSLNMTFCSTPQGSVGKGDDSPPPADWYGYFRLNTPDIPRLMRHGLHWSESDVEKHKSFVVTSQQSGWVARPKCVKDSKDATCYRRFSINSPSRRTWLAWQRQWTAQLYIASHDLDKLASFRLSDLRLDLIVYAHAMDEKNHSVYLFKRRMPRESFNCIYDNMPLGGWWPWPKTEEDGRREEEEEEESEMWEEGGVS